MQILHASSYAFAESATPFGPFICFECFSLANRKNATTTTLSPPDISMLPQRPLRIIVGSIVYVECRRQISFGCMHSRLLNQLKKKTIKIQTKQSDSNETTEFENIVALVEMHLFKCFPLNTALPLRTPFFKCYFWLFFFVKKKKT